MGAQKRRKKALSLRKGATGSNSRLYRISQEHLIRYLSFSYKARRTRLREYRSFWLIRLNAAVRTIKWTYSYFRYRLRQKKLILSRKVLAQLLLVDPIIFDTSIIMLFLMKTLNL